MKIEVGSTWVNKNDLDNTVTVDTVGAFAVTGHSDKDGLYMAHINDFLHYFEPLPDSQYESLSELSEQEFENIIDEVFEEGYAQAYSELQTKTERERVLQERAWDEGYDQAIDDLMASAINANNLSEIIDEAATCLKKANEESVDKYIKDFDDVELLDAICDQIVTAVGLGYMMGFDVQGALKEVIRSNNSKMVDGKFIFDENGKIDKPNSFSEPNLKPYLNKH